MCRILYVRSATGFPIAEHLHPFAQLSENSKEYQGHGWGFSCLRGGEWQTYRNIKPVWEDNVDQFGQTNLLVAHARSAFEDRDIRVENNMPFTDGKYVFVFNGELRGVKIKADGRIGAEKVFNFIKRFDSGDMLAALRKGVDIIKKRTEYVKAMNMIIADKSRAYFATTFGEEPEYFTVRQKQSGDMLQICSEPYPGETDWQKIENNTIRVF
jgi:glutamine amidotransferase